MRVIVAQLTRITWVLAVVFLLSAWLLFHVRTNLYEIRDPYLVATEDKVDGDEGRPIPRWLRYREDRFESAHRVGKNHEFVHAAFEEVVAKINPSTVRIMSGNRQVSLGTVVRADGYIVTKATELPEDIECRVPGGIVRSAKVVAVDQEFDLALLKIDANRLSPGNFDLAVSVPAVGGWVATPSGFTPEPVAVGVVSVPLRRIRSEFAVLGIELEDTENGARVRRVMENSGAANAGLSAGDLVLQIDGTPIPNFAALQQIVRQHRPGEKLTLELQRGEDKLSKRVHLTQRNEVMPDDETIQNAIGGDLSRRRAGFASALQHDTVLSPEQCGGPLVDIDGNLVGINIARAGRVATYALPTAIVKERVTKLLVKTDPQTTSSKTK